MISVLLALALAQQSDLGRTNGDLSRSAPLQLLDESVRQGAISELNFAGEGVVCSRTSNRGTCSIDAGAAVGDIELNPTYQTQAALSLYVDKGGSDSNNCTTAPTACLTIAGAYNKLPRFLAFNATINIDAGTYTESVTYQNKYLANGVTLATTGPLAHAAVTPTTGTGTGTLTAYAAPGAVPAVLTDSTQAWTTNNLRGRFVRMTSGAANNQRRPIVSNTATTLEIAGGYTSNPAAADAYIIETPAAIVSGVWTMSGNTGNTGITTAHSFANLEFTNSTGSSTFSVNAQFPSACTFNSVRMLNSSTGNALAGALRTSGPTVVMNTGTGTGWFNASQTFATNQTNGGAYFVYSSAASAAQFNIRSPGLMTILNNGVIETGSATAHAVWVTGGWGGVLSATSSTSLGHIRCPAGSTGSGFGVTATQSNYGTYPIHYFGFINCAVGIDLRGNINVYLPPPALSFTNVTTAISVAYGGSINIPNCPTLSGVTNEIMVDGVAYTCATLVALTPPSIINPATRSSVVSF